MCKTGEGNGENCVEFFYVLLLSSDLDIVGKLTKVSAYIGRVIFYLTDQGFFANFLGLLGSCTSCKQTVSLVALIESGILGYTYWLRVSSPRRLLFS